jgi:hypothetical protein
VTSIAPTTGRSKSVADGSAPDGRETGSQRDYVSLPGKYEAEA